MPKFQVVKAILQECTWTKKGKLGKMGTNRVEVQFNPESLKLATSNQVAGDNSKGGAALQFASRGTTKLSFEMWFDSTVLPGSTSLTDVREKTKEIAAFMRTKEKICDGGEDNKYAPPGCMFLWGSFLFFGVMESMNETLEFFSDKGVPLRANVSVSLIKQDVSLPKDKGNAGAANSNNVGEQPQQQVRNGETVQSMYAEKWQKKALAQGIDNPRQLPDDTFLPSSCE